MVANALSQKLYQVEEAPLSLNHAEVLAHIALVSDLLEQIIIEQRQDVSEILHIKKLLAEGRGPHFSIDDQGIVNFKNHLVVPSNEELRRKILDEAHNSKLSIHAGTKYVTECDTCGRVKADHMRTPGFLQPLSIPVWKWDDISIDFIVGLPRAS